MRSSKLIATTELPERLHRRAILALACCSFVFFTAETLPVGLLPQLSAGLSISKASVGLLMTGYAAVAAVSAVPLTAATARCPRHILLCALVAVFALSQLMAALAPTFAVLILARALCALAHGVFWSIVAPTASRLGPPGHAGRITSLVTTGNTVGMVLGVPIATVLGQTVGWRAAYGVLSLAGAIATVGLAVLLPQLPVLASGPKRRIRAELHASARLLKVGPVVALVSVTVVLIVGQYASYTYLAPIVHRDAGIAGAGLSLLLLGYGAAGLIGNLIVGRTVDRHPGTLLGLCIAATVLGLVILAVTRDRPETVLAVLIWGAGFSAVPLILQSVAMRLVPSAMDAVSALRLSAFQLGIASGSLLGNRVFDAGHLGALPVISGIMTAVAAVFVLKLHHVFPRTPASRSEAPSGVLA